MAQTSKMFKHTEPIVAFYDNCPHGVTNRVEISALHFVDISDLHLDHRSIAGACKAFTSHPRRSRLDSVMKEI